MLTRSTKALALSSARLNTGLLPSSTPVESSGKLLPVLCIFRIRVTDVYVVAELRP